MNAFSWILAGALIGILASRQVGGRRHLLRNVIVGASGALVGGWLAAPFLGPGTVNDTSLSLIGILAAGVAAVLLLFTAALYRDGTLK